MNTQRLLNFGWAWVGLALALAVHVTDEALNDFLSVYNPGVLAIRARWPFLWFPTFTFKMWLSGLVIAVLLLLALSPFAFREAGWLIIPAYLLGILMTANGLQHIVGSIYMRRMMPGVYSSPILLACSTYLLIATRRRQRRLAVHIRQP